MINNYKYYDIDKEEIISMEIIDKNEDKFGLLEEFK